MITASEFLEHSQHGSLILLSNGVCTSRDSIMFLGIYQLLMQMGFELWNRFWFCCIAIRQFFGVWLHQSSEPSQEKNAFLILQLHFKVKIVFAIEFLLTDNSLQNLHWNTWCYRIASIIPSYCYRPATSKRTVDVVQRTFVVWFLSLAVQYLKSLQARQSRDIPPSCSYMWLWRDYIAWIHCTNASSGTETYKGNWATFLWSRLPKSTLI